MSNSSGVRVWSKENAMRIATLAAALAAVLCGCAAASEPFKDVPEDQWAAAAVQKLKDQGIIQGYPDGSFRGNEPVTRYELAAALVRFAEFLQESVKPPSTQTQHEAEDLPPQTDRSPAAELVARGFLPGDSPLAADPKKPVTVEQLADALASVAQKIIELSVPEGSEGCAAHLEGGSPR